MKIDIKMPKLGESITEGTIVKWLKKPGDRVKKDESLLEISTDKVDSEIPSPYEGVLVEILKKENETVEVDAVIARMEKDGKADSKEEKSIEPEKDSKAEETTGSQEAFEPAEAEGKQEAKSIEPNGDGKVVDVQMPKLGESITEGTIVKWLKKPGDQIKKDESLLEISTDKVDTEIPSPYAGVLVEILKNENETVDVDAVIARIKVGKAAGAASPKKEKPTDTEGGNGRPAKEKEPAKSETGQAPSKTEKPSDGKKFYSPLVLNIARKEGVSMDELEQIPGSGLDGRVTKKDMLKYVEDKKQGIAPKTAEKAAPKVAAQWKDKQVEIIPMDAIRKKIAKHMQESKATSPHVYGVAECDFTHIMEIVKANKAEFEKKEGLKLTFNPFILYAVTKALMDFPGTNASLEGDNIIQKHFINLGIAVATDRGLIVPVLKNAEEKNFLGLARDAYDLAMRARNKKLTVDDVQDSTFTITNYGVFGNIIGFPIINQPNVAILGVGAIKKRPVVIEIGQGDSIGIRSQAFLTLSYDHRVVDGELGDKTLQRVVHYLENITEDII
jgi:2-oxoglutarate dehydrogenase E2 component (dihydrolipoamide succinyltransferase)